MKTAKEYLQEKYPKQLGGHLWNTNPNINDDWVAEMMEEYAQSQLEKERGDTELVGKAIIEVDGFANWYMLQQGLSQEKIDESVADGVAFVNKLIEENKTLKKNETD